MVKYNIPHDVIGKFCQKAGQNCRIQTLAYLVGFKNNDIITVSDIVFPEQNATSTFCEDKGNNFLYYRLFTLIHLRQFIIYIDV